jgi:CBS domain-containing protein
MPPSKPTLRASSTDVSDVSEVSIAEIFPGAKDSVRLVAAIAAADGPADLAGYASEARAFTCRMLDGGIGAEAATRALSLFNDHILQRVLEWAATRYRLPPARWCWLGLGSEGRMEQTLSTDQDNGLLFAAADTREAQSLREHFLPFAQAVNTALAECGFPLCDGGVMAGNPKWCLSLDEWRECFSRWIRTPEPDALLNATIFFDFRPLAGDSELADQLRQYLTGLAKGNDIFLRMMTENALKATPPLGRIKDFVTEANEGKELDLKTYGARLFVDTARIIALTEGVPAAGTLERFAGIGVPRDAVAAQQAFVSLQSIRLAAQRRSPTASNCVNPDELNKFERRVLLASLQQARGLQGQLKARFKIEG